MLTSATDRLFATLDAAMRTVFAHHHAEQACPTVAGDATELSEHEQAEAAALMRVNHAGEIAAQGLYHGQTLAAADPLVRDHLRRAAREEGDHLA